MLPKGYGSVGRISGGSMTKTQSVYEMHLEALWKLSSEIESKLSPVLTGSYPREDKPTPETKLLSDLDKLVERYADIAQRIQL